MFGEEVDADEELATAAGEGEGSGIEDGTGCFMSISFIGIAERKDSQKQRLMQEQTCSYFVFSESSCKFQHIFGHHSGIHRIETGFVEATTYGGWGETLPVRI